VIERLKEASGPMSAASHKEEETMEEARQSPDRSITQLLNF